MIDQITRQPLHITITDIAREAGVSISTVSRVLNGTTPVAQSTAKRVWEAIERLDYTPNAAARQLASQRAKTIGLLLPEISGVFFPPMLRGIERCVRQHGFDLLIYSSGQHDQPDIQMHKRPLGQHNTDGLLVFVESLTERELGWFYRRRFPVVLLHQSSPEGMEIPSVTFENRLGTEALIDHLIEVHGRRRIAFLRGPEGNEDSQEREAGYRAALERHGLPFDPALVECGNFDPRQAGPALQRLLDRGVPFDALFTGDDESAIGVFPVLAQRGIRVPQDLPVVGFDDNYMAPLLPVPLTTVHAPIEEAGFEAARQLFNLIQSGEAEQRVVFPTHLVVRRSCGCEEVHEESSL